MKADLRLKRPILQIRTERYQNRRSIVPQNDASVNESGEIRKRTEMNSDYIKYYPNEDLYFKKYTATCV